MRTYANNSGTAPTRTNDGEFGFAFVSSAYRLYFRLNGSNRYQTITTSSGDYSEYFDNAEGVAFTPGEIVCASGTDKKSVVRCNSPNAGNIIGVVSAGGTQNNDDTEDGIKILHPDQYVNVGLLGQINVEVNLENGPIKAGDYITSSSLKGVGMKQTKPGVAIGQVLEDFDPVNGKGTIQPCSTDPSQSCGQVYIYLKTDWVDPLNSLEAEVSNIKQLFQGDVLNVSGANIQGSTDISGTLNVDGTALVTELKVSGTAEIKNLVVIETATLNILKVTGPAEFGGDINLAASVNTRQAITKKFLASGPIPAGAVVIIDDSKDGYVITTEVAGDTKIIGVAVNEALEEGDEIQVAIGGSVQVLVDEFTAIASGDMIVADNKDGLAKPEASPVVGSLLGKATSAKDADNLIWILITLQ